MYEKLSVPFRAISAIVIEATISEGNPLHDTISAARSFEMVYELVAESCACRLESHDNYHIFSGETTPDIKVRLELPAVYEVKWYYRKVRRLLIETQDLLNRIADKLAETGLLTAEDMRRVREPGKTVFSLKAAM